MSTLRERLDGMVAKWRKDAGSFEITCGDSEVEAAYYGCADELEQALEGMGEGFFLPEQRDLTPVEQAALRRVYAKLYKPAAAPSLHKEGPRDEQERDYGAQMYQRGRQEMRDEVPQEGAGGAVNELRALAEQFSIKGHAVVANPDRARAYEECSGSLINLAQKLSRAAGTEIAPLPLQRTLPDEPLVGAANPIYWEGYNCALDEWELRESLAKKLADSLRDYMKLASDNECVQFGIFSIAKDTLAEFDAAASPAGRTEQP